MERIAVLLVSDQVVPNVLFVKHLWNQGIYIDRILFISTKMMEENEISKNTRDVLGENVKSDVLIVNQDNFEDITNVLNKLTVSKDNEYYINLTCGTKLMMLSAFMKFSPLSNAKLYYMPIRTNDLEEISEKSSNNKKCELKVKINLHDYLRSYGYNFPKDKMNILYSDDISVHKKILTSFLNYTRNSGMEIIGKKLRDLRDEDRKKYPEMFTSEQLDFINSKGFSCDSTFAPTKEFILFITGGWLEEFAYLLFKEKLELSDEFIGINLQAKKKNFNNEFDVMFVKNNTLYYVECKTGLKDKVGDEERSIIGETISKIKSLKDNFGLNVKPCLFTTDGSMRDKQNVIRPGIKDRADDYRIKIIDKFILSDEKLLEQELNDYLK